MDKESILTATDYVNLQKENKLLMDYNQDLLKQLKHKQNVIERAIEKLQLLIDIGFDYDGLNQVDSLKTLIDELVEYARESRNILMEVE